jgi:hypothetical protein
MGQKVTITLNTPIKGPNGVTFSAIVLREPTFDEVIAREDPYTVAVSPAGIPFLVENNDVIRAYIDLCLVEPSDPALLKQADLHAARKVRQAILSFFQPDDGKAADSAISLTK